MTKDSSDIIAKSTPVIDMIQMNEVTTIYILLLFGIIWFLPNWSWHNTDQMKPPKEYG